SDKFQFAYTTLSGNGSITAYVPAPVAVGAGTAGTTATSGVMLRASVSSFVPEAMVSITPGGAVAFQTRSANNGTTTTNATITGITGPIWLRLTRSGTSVSASYSPD